MKAFNVLSIIALALVIIGALNWLLIGIFGFNFVEWISGNVSWIATVIYIVVGIAGLFMIAWFIVRNFNMVAMCSANDSGTKY